MPGADIPGADTSGAEMPRANMPVHAMPGAGTEMVIQRAALGDEEAFADIVRQHQAMVFSIAWHFLGDRSLAEDLAQEVFLECHRNLAEIRSAAHLTNWLRRVTVHRCIDQSRRKSVRGEIALDPAADFAAEDAPADPFLAERLREAIARLPETQRAIVVLRYQEDLEPAEIAALLDMPLNTVKGTLHRGLAALRGKLERKLKEARYALG